ncbi:MAG TPA: TIGR00341 family protein [Terriglobia bacterium]|nr:TIGR00341 family protein [Terriglobia bacterium]
MHEDANRPFEPSLGIYRHEDFRLPADHRDALYRTVLEQSHLDPEYIIMLALSALLALLGLLQNSVAVIIGAMLISPLMNPLLAGALALVLGDGKLGKKTAIVLGLSIGGAILITWFVAEFVPMKQQTPEILARIHPNILDLFIAFLSGLAGTLALRSGSSSLMIIPGVAIAVAVIPPLAVVGYGLSSGQGSTAAGAFLLFVTNLVAIIISAALVFWLMGYRPGGQAEEGQRKLKYRMAASCLVLGILSIPLIQTLRGAITEVRQRSEIMAILDRAFSTENSSVSDLAIAERDGHLRVRATLRTTEYFDGKKIESAQKFVQDAFGPDASLDVDQILVAHGPRGAEEVAHMWNTLTGGVVKPAPQPPPYNYQTAEAELLAHLQKLVGEVLGPGDAPFRRLGPIRARVGANQPVAISVHLASPDPLEPQTVQLLSAQLSARLSSPVELHGEVELEDPSYSLVVEKASERSGLSLSERKALNERLGLMEKRGDLRARITFALSSENPQDALAPLLQRQVEAALSRSPITADRWNVRTVRLRPADVPTMAPPGTRPASPAETKPPATDQANQPLPAVRCEFKVIQNF